MVHCSRRSVVSSSNLNSRLHPNVAAYMYLHICLQIAGKLFQSSGTSYLLTSPLASQCGIMVCSSSAYVCWHHKVKLNNMNLSSFCSCGIRGKSKILSLIFPWRLLPGVSRSEPFIGLRMAMLPNLLRRRCRNLTSFGRWYSFEIWFASQKIKITSSVVKTLVTFPLASLG